MQEALVYSCRCPDCSQPVVHPNKDLHRCLNLFLSRLDEDHRRWFVALESMKVGHGGDRLLSQITGMNVETIRQGRRELAAGLSGFPHERMRRTGAGRPPLKKKTRRS
jgi:hypothetical protein